VETTDALPYVFIFDADMKLIEFDLNLSIAPATRVTWNARPGTYHVMVGSYTRPPTTYRLRARPEPTGAVQ
jgi:hypothetical protein